jgi:predicted amidohydrolase
MLRVGYYQFKPIFGKIEKNLQKVLKNLREVSADLIVLPELAFSGYYFRDREETKSLSEDPRHSPTFDSLIALCRQRDLYLVTGFAEKARDKFFNSAALIGPEGIIHIYRKLHLFNEEKNGFDPGDIPLQVHEIRGAKIGMMICFDWIFPEVMRILTIQGADIICHPSNLVLDYCQNAMISRCIENMVFAITTNLFGEYKRPHGMLKFTGKSQIVAPKGVLLRQAPSQREMLFVTQVDPDLARDKNITPLNQIITDRRPEFYAPISRK